jgi:hypothetical protein
LASRSSWRKPGVPRRKLTERRRSTLDKVRQEMIGDEPGQGVLGEIEAQVRKELGYND